MEKIRKASVLTGGILYLIFGLFHLTFFRIMNPNNPTFNEVTPVLGKIMVMLNIGIVVLFLSLGGILLLYRNEVLSSKPGRALMVMSALFFVIRGSAEFFFPSYRLLFVITMFSVSVVYLVPIFTNRK